MTDKLEEIRARWGIDGDIEAITPEDIKRLLRIAEAAENLSENMWRYTLDYSYRDEADEYQAAPDAVDQLRAALSGKEEG